MRSPPSAFTTAIISVICLLLAVMACANPLDTYRERNRLIVVSLHNAASAEALKAILSDSRTQVDERDLKIIDVSPSAAKIPHTLRLSHEETAQVRKQFQLTAEEKRSVFILLGKDGGEKARQFDSLDLKKWFALIDQMPMRRKEMKSRQQKSD